MANDRYDEDDVDNSAYIPANFDESGRLFNGMIKMRNAVEAGILGFFIYQFLRGVINIDNKILQMSLQYGIAGTIGVLALIGYQGDSLTQTLLMIASFYKDRRKMRFRRIKKQNKTTGNIFGNKKVKAKNKPINKKKKSFFSKSKKVKNTKKNTKISKNIDKKKEKVENNRSEEKTIKKSKKEKTSIINIFKKGGDK